MNFWEHLKRYGLEYYWVNGWHMEVYVRSRDYKFHRRELGQLRTVGCRVDVIPLEF